MNTWKRITAGFGSKRDMLGFATSATPTADQWLEAFTTDFMRYPTAEHGAQTLMSGLRFYTPAFMAEMAGLPAVEARQPAITGNIPRAIYTATRPIVGDVYTRLISQNAQQPAIQAAFAGASSGLVTAYNHDSYGAGGLHY